jgi:Serine/threonine protein kinase
MIKINISAEAMAVNFPQLSEIVELKSGGQKAVYSARHAVHGDVVLKLLPESGHDERVLREIEIVHQNKFPNVPVIHETGTIEANSNVFLYIIEQRIVGQDLRTFLESRDKIPLPIVLDFMDTILATVAELEKKNIVHRDIKPDNILLDGNNKFWLIDFGIARDVSNVSLTATGANFGPYSAGYAPPEQFQNMKRLIDSRADLFAIGVTAYEMIHGENPFLAGANNVIAVLMKTATVTEDPLKISGDSSGELSGFIKTLMQKNHTYRPPSAAVALSWLREIKKTINTEALQ